VTISRPLPLVRLPTAPQPIPELAGAIDPIMRFGVAVWTQRNQVSQAVVVVVTIYVMHLWANTRPAIWILTSISCPLQDSQPRILRHRLTT